MPAMSKQPLCSHPIGSCTMRQQQHNRMGRRLGGGPLEGPDVPLASCCPPLPADQGTALQQQQPQGGQEGWSAAASWLYEAGASRSTGSGRASNAPSTPPHACALATGTPSTGAAKDGSDGDRAATAAQHSAPQAQATAAGGAAAVGNCPPYLLQQRVSAFTACVTQSPLVQSALLYLECGGSHPPPASLPAKGGMADDPAEPAAGLECTLAQLLALHLRAGYLEASESSVLACLWTLEAFSSIWRSSATACLGSYLKLLAAFSPELVHRLTEHWPATVAKLKDSLVAAQSELLRRLGWRLLLSPHSELQPCHTLLFCGKQSLASVCTAVRHKAAVLRSAVTRLPDGHCSCHTARVVEPCGRSTAAAAAAAPASQSASIVPGGSCTGHARLSMKRADVEVYQRPAAKRLRSAA